MSQISHYFDVEERESFCRRAMHMVTGSIVIVMMSAISMFLVQWFMK